MERAQLSEVGRTRYDELLLLVRVLYLEEKNQYFLTKRIKGKTKEICSNS